MWIGGSGFVVDFHSHPGLNWAQASLLPSPVADGTGVCCHTELVQVSLLIR